MEYPYVWRLGEEFTQFSAVRYNEKYYTCIIDHVSSNSTEPGVGANWKTYWVLSSFNYLPKYNQGQEFFFPFFNFILVPPQIFNINPNFGSSCGGTNVTITGFNFGVDAEVFFGSTVASNIAIIDSTIITCMTPEHLGGGAVDVIVTQHTGASKITNGFTYTSTPQIISINPDSGSSCGGTSVTITGDNFAPGDQVFFDSIEATGVVFVDCQTITCVTPIYPGGGVVDASVVRGALIGTLTNGFTFILGTAPIISYTTQQMSVNGTQTLSASGGGGGPYAWYLASGGGTLNPSVGNSTLYTAPVTNPNCANNPQIYVTDMCGLSSAILKIAVNGYGSAPAVGYSVAYSSSGPCQVTIWRGTLGCDNADNSSGYCPSGYSLCCACNLTGFPDCAWNLGGVCNGFSCPSVGGGCWENGGDCIADCSCTGRIWLSNPGYYDVRTSGEKAGGCCPAILL